MQISPEQKRALEEKLASLSPEQMQQLVRAQCPFCRIAAKEIAARTVYEDDHFMAVLDANPANPGHTILFPKAHYSVLPQLQDALAAQLFVLAKKLAGIIFAATEAKGTNIFQASGAVAGQGAPHVVVHIIPRFEGDYIDFSWEPKKLEEGQLDQIQKQIFEKLGAEVAPPKEKAPEPKPKPEKPKKLPKVPPRIA